MSNVTGVANLRNRTAGSAGPTTPANSATFANPVNPGIAPVPIVTSPNAGTNMTVAEKWKLAFDRSVAQLPPKKAAKILKTNSYDQLKAELTILEGKYKDSTFTKVLKWIEPFLQNIKSFNTVIDTAVQANPNISALCWGGIKLVIELSLRLSGAVEKIANGIMDIGQTLPRFELYQNLLPQTPRLNDAFISVYESIVQFLIETILLLSRSPWRNWFRSLWHNYDESLQKRLQKVERQSRVVDTESSASKMELDGTRHDELKRLLASNVGQPSRTTVTTCYMIPFPKNPKFFARTAELEFCKTELSSQQTVQATTSLALHGVGGVGKTSIALEFAYQEKSARNVIIWIASDDETKMTQRFVEAAKELGVHVPNANAEADREAVKNYLEKLNQPWLLVFDNVEDLKALQTYLPAGGSGAIIITSRNPGLEHDLAIKGLKVSAFGVEDGRDFLFSMLPAIGTIEEEKKKAAETLSTKLGGLALGLKQIGGFMRETGQSIDSLLKLLADKEKEKVIFEDASGFANMGYSRDLSTAWKISLSSLNKLTMPILLFFAFMDPDSISESIMSSVQQSMHRFPKTFPGGANELEYHASIRTLVRYGLIDNLNDKNSFAIHRVVQATTMHSVSPEARNEMLNTIIGIFIERHPQSQATSDTLFDQWSICAPYAPHIPRLPTLVNDWKLKFQSQQNFWILLFNCSRYLLETGAMAKCLDLVEKSESFCDATTEKGLLQLAYFYNCRGLISLQHQRVAEGRVWFERTYDIRKKYLGEDDVNTVAVVGNLSLTLLTERRWKDLVDFNTDRQRLLESGKQNHIPLRLSFAIYNLLALAHLEMMQLDDAWKNMCKASEMMKDEIPVFSQLNGYLHYNRGKILAARKQLDEALREHYIGFDIRNKVLGYHVQTAGSCYRTADLMERTGKTDDAIELLLESKKIYENVGLIGTFSKGGSLRSSWRIAQIMRKLKRDQEAEEYEKEVCTGWVLLGNTFKDNLEEPDFNALLNYSDS